MSAEWTRQKFTWLEAVAGDRLARGLPLAVAVVLAVKFFNSETHNAWPSLATLATAVDTDRRSVQRAIQSLVASGWLLRARRRRRSNMYRIAFRASWGGPGAARAMHRLKGGPEASLGGGPDAARIWESNPRDNPREGANAPAPSDPPVFSSGRAGADTARKRRSSPLPEDWILGEREIDAAQRVTDWGLERVQAQFDRFLDWHRARQPSSYDWLAAWTNWCRRGQTFRFGPSDDRTGFRGSVRGLARWRSLQTSDGSD
jgi:Helix-turn-helix domain